MMFGQTDLTLQAANDDVTVYWVADLASNQGVAAPATHTPKTRYAYVEGMVLDGKGIAGKISPLVSCMGGGFYGDTAFFTNANIDGAGVAYMTGPWTVAYTGAATILNGTNGANGEVSDLAVAYDMTDTCKIGVILNDTVGTSTAYNLLVEKTMMISDVTVEAQLLWGLVGTGTYTQTQLFALNLMYMDFYASLTDSLSNVGTGAALKTYSVGYDYALSNSSSLIADYTYDMAASTKTATVGVNFTL